MTYQNGKPKNPEALVESIKGIMNELSTDHPELSKDEMQFFTREALWIALKDAGYEVEYDE